MIAQKRRAYAATLAIASCGCAPSPPSHQSSEDAGAVDAPDLPPVREASAFDVAAPDARLVDSGSAAEASLASYANPVLPRDFPDPFILLEAGRYYAFATNAGGKNVQVATSLDLGTWTELPDALPDLPAWAASNRGLTWAPSVLARNGGYVLYYTARYAMAGLQCISSAVSATPEGPYVDGSTSPFICDVSRCGSIDPSPFVDADGTPYLLWKSDENAPACASPPHLWTARMSGDGRTLAGPPTPLLAMDEDWEQPIIEGPSMICRSGTYFLAYSANAYESASYAMGYATCLSPLGPCKKATVLGPFLASRATALGPGGGEFFQDAAGESWLVYHAWTAPKTTYAGGGERSMRIDRVTFAGNALVVDGPTTTAEPLP